MQRNNSKKETLMSRWQDNFSNHRFYIQWQEILKVSKEISPANKDLARDTEEVARLKKNDKLHQWID